LVFRAVAKAQYAIAELTNTLRSMGKKARDTWSSPLCRPLLIIQHDNRLAERVV
jgi:hypothetical protein